jgi:glycosyltransferase involved in cell wall biosynthesis
MDKKIRICMVIDGWDPIWGGGQIYTEKLCRELVKSGKATVDLFTRDLTPAPTSLPREKDTPAGWNIIKVGPQTPFFNLYGRVATLFTLFFALRAAHKKDPYNVVHAHTYIGVLPAYVFSKFSGLPLCVTMHGTNLTDTKQKGLFAWVERLIVEKLSYSATITVTQKYLHDYPQKKNVFWVPVGVDSTLFHPAEHTENNPSLIFVGRFDPIKGLPLLLEALAQSEPMLELQLVGDGPQKETLQSLVETLGLQKQVTFTGYQAPTKLAELYRKANLFILSSLSEGMPLTLLEAMASGLPVIATKVGELPYLVTPNHGWLAEPNSVPALVEALNTAFAHRKDWHRIGKANAELVSKEFTWENVAEKTFSIYTQLLTGHGSK